MGSDAAIPCAPVSRDLGRKKKANRSARLKQCKLDARREQWLSQGKIMGSKCVNDVLAQQYVCAQEKQGNVEVRSRAGGCDVGRSQPLSIDISMNRPWENSSETDCPGNSLGSRSSSSSSSSRSTSDADSFDEDDVRSHDEEEGETDDWEAIADALTTASDPQIQTKKDASSVLLSPIVPVENNYNPSRGILRTPPVPMLQAWKPDDAFRPRNFPNLSKQHSLHKKLFESCASGNGGGSFRNFDLEALSCPICFEDLDITDTSFLPCYCGFRLCLFCHKRILEEDGRCPGCRNHYGSIICNEVPGMGASLQCTGLYPRTN